MLPFIVYTPHFPPRRFLAITLFPFVFYNKKPLSDRDVRHETVHLWQQLALLILPFYLLYFLFWLYGLIRYRNGYQSYLAIPFERSAYSLESQKSPTPLHCMFDWVLRIKL